MAPALRCLWLCCVQGSDKGYDKGYAKGYAHACAQQSFGARPCARGLLSLKRNRLRVPLPRASSLFEQRLGTLCALAKCVLVPHPPFLHALVDTDALSVEALLVWGLAAGGE